MIRAIDWSNCDDVERHSDVVSGAWVVKGSRIPADAVIDNADDGYTAEEIATEIYEGISTERLSRIISFARRHVPHPA